MENEFTKVMSERTDEELISIVTVERDKYNPVAIEAADAEVEKRNIDTSEFEKIREKATSEKAQKEIVDSNVVGPGIRFVNFLTDFIIWLLIAGILTYPLNANDGNQMLIGYLLIFQNFTIRH